MPDERLTADPYPGSDPGEWSAVCSLRGAEMPRAAICARRWEMVGREMAGIYCTGLAKT
jgi:hypothetical protein